MKDSTPNFRRAAQGLAACVLLVGAAASAFGQTANATYRGAPRDPFTKYKPNLKTRLIKPVAKPVEVPPIKARIDNYKAQKQAAMSLQQPAPKPTTALLLSELQVIGIFRTPRGYAAMVEATPIHLSYVVYPGEPFYDGMLVAIEETRLVFRRQTRWTDGRTEVAVETKQLRQASVSDSMAATREPEAAPAKGSSEVNAFLEVLKALAAANAQQQQQPQQPGGQAAPQHGTGAGAGAGSNASRP
ncbi:MAG TPA: hypothetical protein VGX48_27410 [Pyrinomonadaceae bacterium]|nr:hypothetical protein [Pyrinomonadaceae bacterium]